MKGISRRAVLTGVALVGAATFGPLLPTMCAMRRNRGIKGMVADNAPKRPHGQPKPMLEEDIAPIIARLDSWYAARLPADEYVFNPPATDAQLDAFEKVVGVKLPRAYRQLYEWHDGDGNELSGHIYGLQLLPLKDAGYQWRMWNRVLADFEGNRYAVSAGAWPEGAVDPAYINPRWIPLTHDAGGNHIGLDFDPWPGGRIGQVILFGRDEDIKAVLAPSLGTFLNWVADLLEAGNFRLAKGRNGNAAVFELKDPPLAFPEGARRLRGAPGPFL